MVGQMVVWLPALVALESPLLHCTLWPTISIGLRFLYNGVSIETGAGAMHVTRCCRCTRVSQILLLG